VIVTTLQISNLSFTGRDDLPLVRMFQFGETIADEQELIPSAFSVAE